MVESVEADRQHTGDALPRVVGGSAGGVASLLRRKCRRGGAKRGQKNDTGKPPSNPRGWPDRSEPEDLVERPHRLIVLNEEQPKWFCDNFVRTSKYTLLDFLPRFLMEEFHPRRKMANVYFLVLASLQTIKEITNTFGVPTILLPLSVVIIIDAVFAILEDVARHRADAKANASPTRVFDLNGSSRRFRRVQWSNVRVGDLLVVKNRESIPADLLLIGAHEPNPEAKAGMCYVETKSLDGETNLKIRKVIRPTIGRVSSPKDAASIRGRVEMEHPNKLIDNFSGAIELESGGADGGPCREPIQTQNLLLRGCVLRNTKWVVGLVLNTGPDTKIIMSSLEPPHKSSRLEQRTNLEVWRIVRLLCLVCLLGAVGSLVWNQQSSADHVYLVWDLRGWGSHVRVAIIQFFYLFLLLGNFIPVSLYVSMSTVKFCQAFFMKQDLDMYHEETDTPAMVRTMALNEELGQVSHVFSDKTGTLTQNVMEFRKCSIGGVSYGRGVTDIGRAVAMEMGQEIPKEDLEAEFVISSQPAVPHVRFYDPQLLQDLEGAAGEEQRALLTDFFLALAVCHTVIPERDVSKMRRRRGRNRRCPATTTTTTTNTGGDSNGNLDGGVNSLGCEDPVTDVDCSELGDSSGGLRRMDSDWRTDDEDEEHHRAWEADLETGVGRGYVTSGGEAFDERQNEEEDDEEEAQPKLSASSPDDEALVLGARHFGMEFRDRVDNSACVRRSGAFLRDARGRASPVIRSFRPQGSADRTAESPRFVDERYEVLRILDFTSARKRMSVIVRDPQGQVRILCKGADSVMIPRLAAAGAGAGARASIQAETLATAATAAAATDRGVQGAGVSLAAVVAAFGGKEDSARGMGGETMGGLEGTWSTSSEDNLPSGARSRERTFEHMECYAREGLRTLLVTCADLDTDWFRTWDKRFEAASTDLTQVERKKEGLENDIDRLMDEVEANLKLLGCTAIEDKLQDGVGSCVDALQGAGVRVWMLTGDKEETAVNIGVACQLLGPEDIMERIVINVDPQTGCQSVEEVRDRLEEELHRISDERPKTIKDMEVTNNPRPRALIVDGPALSLATEPLCRRFLAELAMECAAVVCCRVSPDQKREVVALVRETIPEARTLAIGDGANDVAMIQGAHIGVGISGQEGMQAVNASDFAIAQFRFLRKLMLFHGRQNYRRMSKLVVYTFYKNVLMAVPMAWYIVTNGYSGQKFYTEGGIQMYNILFTTWPVLFLGCFDRDVTLEDTDRFPGLYVLGINDVFFNAKVFWSWMSQAMAEAALITFVPVLLLKGGPGDFGTEQSLFFFGGTTFTLVVLLANSKLLWLQYRWTWWAAALVILSILSWFGAACTLNTMLYFDYDFYMVYFQLLANPTFWAVVALCFTAVVMRDLTWKFYHRWWQPKLHHIILENEAKGGDPVQLTAEECAAASARGGGGGGGGSGGGGGGGGGGARGNRVDRSAGGARRRRRRRRRGSGGGDTEPEVANRRRGSGGTDILTVGTEGDSRRGSGSRPARPMMTDWNDDSSRRSSRTPVVDDHREGLLRGTSSEDAVAAVDTEDGMVPSKLTTVFGSGAETGSGSGKRRCRRKAPELVLEVEEEEGERGQYLGGSRENEATAAKRQPTEDTISSSRPSSVGSAREDGGFPVNTPATSVTRSLSWTLPLEPYPHAALALTRSRSERINKRHPMHGSVGTRFSHPRPPSGGYAYSTDEASASLESEMILNYVESPLKKTPAFWDTPRPTLNRLVRRWESGLLPAGYGTGRWTTKSSAGPVGPRPRREALPMASRLVTDKSFQRSGDSGEDVSSGGEWRAPAYLLGAGSDGGDGVDGSSSGEISRHQSEGRLNRLHGGNARPDFSGPRRASHGSGLQDRPSKPRRRRARSSSDDGPRVRSGVGTGRGSGAAADGRRHDAADGTGVSSSSSSRRYPGGGFTVAASVAADVVAARSHRKKAGGPSAAVVDGGRGGDEGRGDAGGERKHQPGLQEWKWT